MRSIQIHRKASSILARRSLSSLSSKSSSSSIIQQATFGVCDGPRFHHSREQIFYEKIHKREGAHRRHFTSNATLNTQHDTINTSTNAMFPTQDELISGTEVILDSVQFPLGNFTSDTMDEAVRLIESWSRSKHSSLGAELVTKLLYRIIDENKEGNPHAYFNSSMAETVCLYWREVSIEISPYKILEIAEEMKSILGDDAMPYNNLIAILMKCRNKQGAVAVEGLLFQMIQLQKEGIIDQNIVDEVTYNSAISAWMYVAQEDKEAGERAVAILNRMKGSYRIGDGLVKPSILSFSMAINTLLRCEGHAAALQAEDMIQDLIYFHRKSWKDDDMAELKRLFDNVLNALNQLTTYDQCAADRCLSLLRFMEKVQGLSPDLKTFNIVIAALAKQRNEICISLIEGLIDEMNNSKRYTFVNPNTRTYNSLIKAYVKHDKEMSADSLLRKMELDYEKGNEEMKPDSITWNLVIEGHAKCRKKRSAHNATNVMDRMVEFGKKHPDVQPDKVTISSMMKSLIQKASRGDRIAGKQAVQIIDKMVNSYKEGNELMKPDKIIFSMVIDCVAKSGGTSAGFQALVLLNRMQEMHKKGYKNMKPDIVSLNTTLSALANSQTRTSAEKAEELLKAMISSNDPDLKPNVQSYTLVISAWAKSNDREATIKCEKLLLDMEKIEGAKPNIVSYSTALNAFAKSRDPTSYKRAMDVLERMENGDIDLRPNAYCYASVMECISNSREKDGICAMAKSLLKRMIDQSQSGKSGTGSYTVVLNTAIKAVERSSEKRKDKVAVDFLTLMKRMNEMERASATPNVRTYNAVIRACAFSKGDVRERKIAFDAALDSLKDLRATSTGPDLYTYPALFRAGEELLGHSDEDLACFRSIFDMCCQDGLVDALLLKNMVNFLPKDFMRSILKTNKEPILVRLNHLPHEWKSNIYNQKYRGRKMGKRQK